MENPYRCNTLLRLLLLAWFTLCSCAQGDSQLLISEDSVAKKTIEEVQILHTVPEQSYRILGTVTGKAFIPYWFNAVDAENAAFKECKKAAANAGADAIIEMRLKVFEGEKVIYAEPWDGFSWGHGKGRVPYTIVFDGIAIMFQEE